ncbi:MAG TPA: response regulator [Kofleriaceae bacterium]|jgi:DNA-binding response OmpR family regulator
MRVLLADDDPSLRRALGMSLTRAGYQVTVVDDGEMAIELAAEQPFDIVIADYNMARVGGVQVIKHFKERFGGDVCCIVLSGDDDDLMNAACYKAGADDVLVKPLTPTELRTRVTLAARSLRAA